MGDPVVDMRSEARRYRGGRPPLLIAAGTRFGRLVVTGPAPMQGHYAAFSARCDCGGAKAVSGTKLRSGKVRSCGCLIKDALSAAKSTHRDTRKEVGATVEYVAWRSMKQRCYNPKNASYSRYGGRGIAVCDRWLESYEAFLAHVGRRPSPEHSIDRYPDNDGNYEPGNVRWATAEEQGRNRETNIVVHLDGEVLILKDACARTGHSYHAVIERIRSGMAAEDALKLKKWERKAS